jgi:oligopeptide/dipeptide ABC transporter ATP-binding protein
MFETLLSVEDLQVTFQTYAGTVYAVNGMTFEVGKGEFFGLVGESGCGKSVTSLAILGILPGQGKITGGRITFLGQELTQAQEAVLQEVRGKKIAMIFQDPSASLNPVFTVGNQINRIIRYHTGVSHKEAHQKAMKLFEEVALPDPECIYTTYPHQLSGGMQQRVMIAMALASGANLLIADEPTTALDVTIQEQILELLVELRKRQQLSILLITHNLGVVAETCDRIGVAYAGRIVEIGPIRKVLDHMKHPYTHGLLAALPDPQRKGKELQSIPGYVPDGMAVTPGCPFHPRCPQVMEICTKRPPAQMAVNGSDHLVSCYLYSREVKS